MDWDLNQTCYKSFKFGTCGVPECVLSKKYWFQSLGGITGHSALTYGPLLKEELCRQR